MQDDIPQKAAEKVELKESNLSEQLPEPVPPEPVSLEPVLQEPVVNPVLQEIDQIRKSLPQPGGADPFNPKLDKGTRLLIFLYVGGLGAFGSWIVSTGSIYFAVSTLVVGTLLIFCIAKMVGTRLDTLLVKNPVGMKFVVGLSSVGIMLATWLLVRLIFAVMGLPADR